MRMVIPTWTNKSLAFDLLNEMDQMFNATPRQLAAYDERTFGPACEVTETEEHFLLSLDIPGMKKEEIKIELKEDILTVSGERKRELNANAKEKFNRYEKSYGFFKRSFNLPSHIDSTKVEAQYDSGVLELYIPKAQSAKAKQIEIQEGKGSFFNKLLGSKKSQAEVKES